MAEKVTVTLYGRDDGRVISTLHFTEINGELVRVIKGADCAKISKCQQAVKRKTPGTDKKNQEIEIISARLNVVVGKKQKICCPFHKDNNPSAELTAAGGFRCFSSNCEAGSKYMTRSVFVKKLSEING